MDETLIGTIPSKPMTNQQRRAHRRLAAAEKTLIAHLVWEAPVEVIERDERRCVKYTKAWKRACRG